MELENKTEHVHETIQERARTSHAEGSSPPWFTQVALSTLMMALLSALAALMGAISSHDSILERTQEIVDFVRLDNDSVEIEVLRSKHDLLVHLGEEPSASEVSRVRLYEENREKMSKRTANDEGVVRAETHAYVIFAVAVTLLSVGITLGGMSMIAKKRFLWVIGLALGAGGAVTVVLGLRAML
jgi:Domain of unknown function (DUF4337)